MRKYVPVLVVFLAFLAAGCGPDASGAGATAGQGNQGQGQGQGQNANNKTAFGNAEDAAKSTARVLYLRDAKTLYENATTRWKQDAGSAENLGSQIENEAAYYNGHMKRDAALPKGGIRVPSDGYLGSSPSTSEQRRQRASLRFDDPEGNAAQMDVDLVSADDGSLLVDGMMLKSARDPIEYKFGVAKSWGYRINL